jgi:hypothetical protein
MLSYPFLNIFCHAGIIRAISALGYIYGPFSRDRAPLLGFSKPRIRSVPRRDFCYPQKSPPP